MDVARRDKQKRDAEIGGRVDGGGEYLMLREVGFL